jgi:hypothetical protein
MENMLKKTLMIGSVQSVGLAMVWSRAFDELPRGEPFLVFHDGRENVLDDHDGCEISLSAPPAENAVMSLAVKTGETGRLEWDARENVVVFPTDRFAEWRDGNAVVCSAKLRIGVGPIVSSDPADGRAVFGRKAIEAWLRREIGPVSDADAAAKWNTTVERLVRLALAIDCVFDFPEFATIASGIEIGDLIKSLADIAALRHKSPQQKAEAEAVIEKLGARGVSRANIAKYLKVVIEKRAAELFEMLA